MHTVDWPRDTGLGVAEETPKMVQQAPQVVNTTAGSPPFNDHPVTPSHFHYRLV